MVTFMNETGAVHTVTKDMFEEFYKGKVRKLSKPQMKKLTELDEAVAVAQQARKAGENPAEEAKALYSAVTARKGFTKTILGDD